MNPQLITLDIRYENDVVGARQKARKIAAALKFDRQDQTRIATAVSEIARNAFQRPTADGTRMESHPAALQRREHQDSIATSIGRDHASVTVGDQMGGARTGRR